MENNAARPEDLPEIRWLEKVKNVVERHSFLVQVLFVTLALVILAFYYYRQTDLCVGKDGKRETCMDIFKCPSAFNERKEGKKPVFCDKGKVCCLEDNILDERHLRPPEIENTSTTDDFANRSFLIIPTPVDRCEPLTNFSMTAPSRISFQKCLQYQDLLVYPCRIERMNVILEDERMARMNHCNWKSDNTTITDAYYGEFPHMALLGYDSPDYEWQCSGLIISERFILTAGHCTSSPISGNVTKVRIGFLKISQTIQQDELYNVSDIHKHPDYKSPLKYHDIALLKTDREMILNRYRVPACLHDGAPFDDSAVIVTGWGNAIANNQPLQKRKLDKYTDEECYALYSPNLARLMPRGYDSNTQICYGDRSTGKDISRGDSGGPAQISHPYVHCMYLVTAIVSHSKKIDYYPQIFTRIAPYLSWIEYVVWN